MLADGGINEWNLFFILTGNYCMCLTATGLEYIQLSLACVFPHLFSHINSSSLFKLQLTETIFPFSIFSPISIAVVYQPTKQEWRKEVKGRKGSKDSKMKKISNGNSLHFPFFATFFWWTFIQSFTLLIKYVHIQHWVFPKLITFTCVYMI